MSTEATHPQTTTLPQLGRYQLLEKLGQGGMGEVYLAHDAKLNRCVAVKVLPAHCIHDAGAVARFRREAQALAQLAHPGIIQAFDSGEEADRHFLVMEYVEGKSLAALLVEKGRLPPARAADYAYQAALALQHAHDKGMVHRDIKPSNLLLATQGQVKLLDLGLARFLQDQIDDAARTREGVGMGTPDYAAPEQFRDAHSADTRADIYALGCTLFHLLTGQVPFPGSSFSEKYEAHAHKEPPAVEELCPEVPGGLALVVQKMMAKRPADRFHSAAEVAEALAPFVAGSSATFQNVRKTSSWDGGRLTVRDTRLYRPRRYALAAGAGLVLVVLAAILGWHWRAGARVAEADAGNTPDKPSSASNDNTTRPGKDSALPEDANVLTVAQTRAGGGKYQTIAAALEDVQPGQTIRVLDNAVYREPVVFSLPRRHEGVTLEAVRGATLETTTATDLITISSVGRVTIRGFHLRATNVTQADRGAILVFVTGACPGLVLEDLHGETNRPGCYNGVLFVDSRNEASRLPAVVRRCVFRDAQIGVAVSGSSDDFTIPRPSGGVIVQDNLIIHPSRIGVQLQGTLYQVHIVGNRITRAGQVGLLLGRLFPQTKGILVANNTILDSGLSFVLQDNGVKGTDIQFRNNLILASRGPDMSFVAGGSGEELRAQDGKELLEAWRIDHNWREGKPPTDTDATSRGWIPPGKEDVLQEQINGVRRDLDKEDDFLRPEKDSPLASRGAGQTDPWLPTYVGALPPKGRKGWDWDRAWHSRMGKPAPGKESGRDK